MGVAAIPVVAVFVAIACEVQPLTPAPPVRTEVEQLRVDVVGDSLTRQSTPYIQQRLLNGGYSSSVQSMPSQDMRSTFVQGALDSLVGNGGDILVLGTAANDAVTQGQRTTETYQATASAAYRKLLGEVVHRFADRCVVIVNGKENISPLYSPAQVVIVNENIRAEKAQRANMVIADWAKDSQLLTADKFYADTLHFGPDVYSSANTLPSAPAYAATITGAVRACEQMLRPSTATTTRAPA